VSRYQKGKTNLDFTEERDSEWQWHQLGHMQVCTSLQTDNHASTHHSVFTGRMPFLPPNQQRESTQGFYLHHQPAQKSVNWRGSFGDVVETRNSHEEQFTPDILMQDRLHNSIIESLRHCSHGMRQGLCNGAVSVRLSVPYIDRRTPLRRVCCCGPGGQETSIVSGGSRALQQHGTQQLGVQQQMRAVSRCQLT